jgi:hypothetical protein
MAAKEIAERAPPSCRVEEISALLVCFPVLRRQVMRRFSCSILFASICVVVTAQQPSTPANLHFNGQSWWEKVKVIADDKMEGRDTGSAASTPHWSMRLQSSKKPACSLPE